MSIKILIVEDDIIIQMYIEQVILKEGYEIVGMVSDSSDALEAIEKQNPNLIFMDIGIQGKKNGIETAELINKSYKIPLVFMTGNSDQKTLSEARATNPIQILFKPIDERYFTIQLKEICDKIQMNL